MRFQRCPITPLDSYAGNITFTDGSTADVGDITFDPGSYHFTYYGKDVTNQLTQSQKAAGWKKFDRAKDNLRAYNESQLKQGKTPVPTGSTSTIGIFAEQLFTDPLGAPLESLDKKVKQVVTSSGVQTILITAIIGYGLVLFFQSRALQR
jgi:hypothetical protein